MTLYRYLYREIMKPFVFMCAVLFLLLIATEVSDTLTKVLTGQFTDNAIWIIIGFQVPVLLAEIIPAAFFLACLTTLHLISQDSERAILLAIGISDTDLLRFLMLFAVLPVMIVMLGLSHYITPKSEARLASFIQEQRNRPITDIIDANSFYKIGQLNSTFFASDNNPRTGELLEVVTIQKQKNTYTVISAESIRTGITNNNQTFVFRDGERVGFSLNADEETLSHRFKTMQINIPEEAPEQQRNHRKTVITTNLIGSRHRADQMAVMDRFSTALYIPMFCIWAIALTRFKPRSAKVGAMAFGIVFYVLTNFTYRTLAGAVSKSDISTLFAPRWFMVIFSVVGFFYIRRKNV